MEKIIGVAVLLCLAACGDKQVAPSQNAEMKNKQSAAPAIAQKQHFYEGKEGTTYFYSKGISQADRQSGHVANELLEVNYIGTKNGGFQAVIRDGERAHLIACNSPCEFFTETLIVYDEVVKTLRYKNVPGSIAWNIFVDASNGELEPTRVKINGKYQEGWFAPEKGRFVPLKPA